MASPISKNRQNIEERKKRREADALKRQQEANKKPTALATSIPQFSKADGLNLLSQIVIDQSKGLASTYLPTILKIASEQLGIDLTLNPQDQPCLANAETAYSVIETLNNIINGINSVGNFFDTIQNTVNSINPVINTTQDVINALNIALPAISTAIKAVPPAIPVPSQVIAAVDDIDFIKALIQYQPDGQPRIPLLKASIGALSSSLTFIQAPLSLIIDYINKIIAYFEKCVPPNPNFPSLESLSPSLLSLPQNLQSTNQPQNFDNYQGFILEIEEKELTPTVKQRRAVGKNKSGIVLIQTPYSFTTNNQVLFDELKFIIDRDNLKGY